MEIRAIRPEEFERAGEIIVAAYRTLDAPHMGPGGHFEDTYAQELRNVERRAALATVLVAVEDGHVLGAVTYVSGPGEYAEFDDEDAAGIRMLAVAPEAQGRGVGAALVRACIDAARADGSARVVLHTTPWMHGAHRLYANLGFRREPARDWSPSPEVPLKGLVLDL